MKSKNDSAKEYFTKAYQTGSDIWTHIPYHQTAREIISTVVPHGTILDIGAGRGLLIQELIKYKYKVIGIDYVKNIVDETNTTIRNNRNEYLARCVHADTFNIPFRESSIGLITDIGTFQHLNKIHREQYIQEIFHTLKTNAYYLNVSLSQKTKLFYGWEPYKNHQTTYEKFGVPYHFFSKNDIKIMCESHFNIIHQQHETYPSLTDPKEEIILLFTLMQKKNDLI